jgi:hypothetical protein
VRRLLALLGGIALLRAWLARRRARAETDPAEELRRKVEASRKLAADQEEFAAGETPVDLSPEGPAPSPGAPGDADERRREVHERGRAAIDDMRGEG